MSIRKSIAIDMDNVIADVITQMINWYERDYGIRVDPSALRGVPESEAFPDKTAIRKFLFMPGFFRTVPVMPGAQDALKKLMDKYDVYIVSAAMEFPQSLSEKLEWMHEHFPFISWKHIMFCGDKSIVGTDIMIDDHLKNLDYFKGEKYLYTAGHNINVDRHIRVNNWDEVLKALL